MIIVTKKAKNRIFIYLNMIPTIFNGHEWVSPPLTKYHQKHCPPAPCWDQGTHLLKHHAARDLHFRLLEMMAPWQTTFAHHMVDTWETPSRTFQWTKTYGSWRRIFTPANHVKHVPVPPSTSARHASGFFTSMVSLSMPGLPRATARRGKWIPSPQSWWWIAMLTLDVVPSSSTRPASCTLSID